MDIFRKLNRELAVSVVIVTHDLALANKVDRIVAIRDGLTSTEFVKRNANLDTEVVPGMSEVHEAFVIIDRAGRLQVPREYLEALSIDNRATLEFDGERIVITQPK